MCPQGADASSISFIPSAISRGVAMILSAFDRGQRSLPSLATICAKGSGILPGPITRIASRNFSKYMCCPTEPALSARWPI
jgi:hypothetical protein